VGQYQYHSPSKKFHKNPHHHSKVMIKSLEGSATGNEFAQPIDELAKTLLSVFKIT
jgi:hypothetical protein